MSTAVEKKRATEQNKRIRTHNYSTGGLYILAFPKLRGQPPEQSIRSSGETCIAHLTIEKKTPYLYPAAWQLAGKDTQTVTDKIEEKQSRSATGTSTQKNPNYNGSLATKLQPTD